MFAVKCGACNRLNVHSLRELLNQISVNMCIVHKKNNNREKQKYAAISYSPSLQSIKKGTYVCEVGIVANQITSKSENEPTNLDSLYCLLLFIRTTLKMDYEKEREIKKERERERVGEQNILTHDDQCKSIHTLNDFAIV